MRGAFIPFVVVGALVSPGLSCAEESEHDALAAEFERREAEIGAEIIDGSGVWWAGQYHSGDGFGGNVTLVIAPDHGFAAVSTGCLGVYGRSFGSVMEQGSRLLLTDEMSDQPGMFGSFSNVLVPVRKGQESYLVSEERVAEFLQAVSTESDDCPDLCNRFLMRNWDWDQIAVRNPTLAAKYTPGSSERPLYVRVTKVIEPDLDAVDGAFRWRKSTVELDVGLNGGIREGMEFFSSTAGWITDTITVVKVDDTSAVATVSAYDQLPIPVQTGTCVSTYYDDAIEKRIYGQPHSGCDDGTIIE